MRSHLILATGLCLVLASTPGVRAEDSDTAPRPIPLTRPDLKRLIEDMKLRKPRIPLPELTAEEKEKAKTAERGSGGYEGRLRSLYMPGMGDGRGGFGFQKDPDANISLDYKFKTQLFWIVSRANNCQYCLGHQESKLLATGMTDDEIAALDSNWDSSTPAQQAAYAFARKFTFEPHKLNDADIEALRKHFKDLQILEMVLSMAGNNSINRWKEGTGVPQSSNGGGFRSKDGKAPPEDRPAEKQSYLTPTSEAYKTKQTKVAPFAVDEKSGEPTKMTVCRRPTLESRDQVEVALAAAHKRTSRLPLLDEAKAREILGKDFPVDKAITEWERLLLNFPSQGKGRIATQRSAEEKGDLKPLLKAQMAWIVARQDRAWYATGRAKAKLMELGQTEDQIYKLDGDWADFSAADKSLFTIAKKLAASPVVLTDEEVMAALKLTGPKEVVQTISYTTNLASLDRITESAGLRIEK